MSYHTEHYKTSIYDIVHEAELKLVEKYEENISLEKYSLIGEFLDELVFCGELTDTNRQRIEGNVHLNKWFQQPKNPSQHRTLALCDGRSPRSRIRQCWDVVIEDDKIFRGRTTFPEENYKKTNRFIKDYIESNWPDFNVMEPRKGHPLWRDKEERSIIYRYERDGVICTERSTHETMILHGEIMEDKAVREIRGRYDRKPKKSFNKYYGTISGKYPGGDPYLIDLRGKKFKELDELLCIL